MADGGKMFPYLLSKFQTKSRVNTSIASLIQTTAVAAFKLRGASKSIWNAKSVMAVIKVTVSLRPIAFNWLYGFGKYFSLNNVKYKDHCGGD